MSVQESINDSFESLIEIHSKRLLNRAYYLLSNKEDAEDVVQEVFLVAYSQRKSFEGVKSVEAWLLGILYHKVADIYKERYRRPVVTVSFEHDFDQYGEWRRTDVAQVWEEHPESFEALLDNSDFRQSFYGCLEKLPPKWKIAVKLCYLQGKKAGEVCKELAISSTAYWKLLQRSRLRLRECIDLNWFSK